VIRKRYEATRETKEKPILERLAEGQKLIEEGGDIKPVDSLGRNVAPLGRVRVQLRRQPSVLTKYEEAAHELIHRGVEVNREDAYNDSALDYLLYSPNFEMQTLMLEHGATSGFFAAFYNLFAPCSRGSGAAGKLLSAAECRAVTKPPRPPIQADLSPGLRIPIHLETRNVTGSTMNCC
jgi:hypothetical protein